jgi:hypothetical protein
LRLRKICSLSVGRRWLALAFTLLFLRLAPSLFIFHRQGFPDSVVIFACLPPPSLLDNGYLVDFEGIIVVRLCIVAGGLVEVCACCDWLREIEGSGWCLS